MQLNPIGSNMTEVETSEARILFSYRTPVAAYVYGEGVPIAGEMYRGFVRTAKWWSVTTSRHINKWLDGGTAEEVSQTYLDNLVQEVIIKLWDSTNPIYHLKTVFGYTFL